MFSFLSSSCGNYYKLREEEFGRKVAQKSWKNLIDSNRFEQQTFPITAMFACSRYVGM